MGVSFDIYRAAIGLFCFFKLLYAKTCLFTVSFASLCLHLGALLASFFLICLDVHMNPGPERSTSLKVGHLNARSINISRRANVIEKFEEITSIILNENFNIFALSETWLNASIPNHLFDIPGFRPLIRLGRSDGRRAGGVVLYVSSEFAPRRRLDLETNEFELLWVEVKINFFTLICGVCYRP